MTINAAGSFTIQVQNGAGTTLSNGATLTVNSGGPTIQNISPTAATTGSFPLTINGSGFDPSTAQIVVWPQLSDFFIVCGAEQRVDHQDRESTDWASGNQCLGQLHDSSAERFRDSTIQWGDADRKLQWSDDPEHLADRSNHRIFPLDHQWKQLRSCDCADCCYRP